MPNSKERKLALSETRVSDRSARQLEIAFIIDLAMPVEVIESESEVDAYLSEKKILVN